MTRKGTAWLRDATAQRYEFKKGMKQMTLGTIIFCIIMTVVILLIAAGLMNAGTDLEERKAPAYIAIVLTACLFIGGTWGGCYWRAHYTERGKREYKTQQSNFGNGLKRNIKVYGVNGELVYEYSGRFDVVHDSERVLFDDENGKRHVVYFGAGQAVIEEVE